MRDASLRGRPKLALKHRQNRRPDKGDARDDEAEANKLRWDSEDDSQQVRARGSMHSSVSGNHTNLTPHKAVVNST